MAVVIAVSFLGLVALALIVLVAREKTPTPDDVAVAYERAWDRLDFATLWDLSGPELRDGRDRAAFLAAKRAAYADRAALGHQARAVTAQVVSIDPESAIVATAVVTDTQTVAHQCTLARRNGRWWVVAHTAA
ncbi:MAG: hypothetical protein ACOYN3_08505 [Acidimicrobiia bacterium]